MKSFKKLTLCASLMLPFAVAGCDLAGVSPTDFRSKVSGYEVDLPSAIELAGGAVSGVVVDAEYDDGRWEVEVVSGASRVRVAVDPESGATKVVSTRPANAEELAGAELVVSAPTSLAQAIDIASSSLPGALAYEIKAEGGHYEVELVDGLSFYDVELNPLSGEVDSVEEDQDEDPELDDDSDDDEEDEDEGEEDEDEGEEDEDENEEDEDEGDEDEEDEDEGEEDEDEGEEDEDEDEEDEDEDEGEEDEDEGEEDEDEGEEDEDEGEEDEGENNDNDGEGNL